MTYLTRFFSLAAMAAFCATAPLAYGVDFFYVGASGGDFFDESNWNDAADGSGSMLAGDPLMDDVANAIAIDLIIDGDNVLAAGQVDFGTGSLTMTAGSIFEVSGSGNDLDLNDDTTTSITGATLIVDDFIQLGGMVTLNGASLTASDDINFHGQISIIDTMVESTGDDIEFRNTATITAITGSDFLVSATGSGGGLSEVIFFRASTPEILDSTFRGGRFGVITDGSGTTTLVRATDSTFEFDGDIETIFASSDGGIHQLLLSGNSSIIADQLEIVALFLDDSATATFTDDTADSDGDSWLTDNALLRLDSTSASVTFQNDQTADTRSRIFNGLNFTTYAAAPGGFDPSSWDGISAVTLRLVPEPTSAILCASLLLCLTTARSRRES